MSALQRETLAFRNPNKEWVVKELDALICEWRAWQKEAELLGEDPHDPFDPKPGRILADGEENIKKHRILQEKTLAFLENNIAGHGFITGRDRTKIDRTDLRLKIRVKHRLDDLDELRACLEYAETANVQPVTTTAEHRSEIVTLKPGIWGISFDVKEALRRIRARLQG
jgi:hypothetical protein